MTQFTHLHVHTQYSLLDGAARITDLVKRASELGMTSLAITDHGVLYGLVDFFKECKKYEIKPILGIETYVTEHMEEKSHHRAHLILLAKNDKGLKNLYVLSSDAFTRGFYIKPRIDYDFLEAHSEGLICLSACIAGDIPQLILRDRKDEAYELAKRLKGIFGDDFYLEIQDHGMEEEHRVIPILAEIGAQLGIKLVATNDIHYIDKADAKYQDLLLCIQTNATINQENRMRMSSSEYYLKTQDEMQRLFAAYPEAITSTEEIAAKCDAHIETGVRYMPEFVAPDGYTNVEYLRKLCDDGLVFRGMADDKTARDRLEYEISVIEQMGFVDYFLIVYDFIRFARENNIMIGPGRGSGVGSLCAYCLRITDINPLRYSLLFERLLNPERVSMPDIDVDMCIERRQEVIEYVYEKYGHDRVSQIVTFGTLKAKAVVKDVARALSYPPDFGSKIASLIPAELNITLERALEESSELKKLVDTDEAAEQVMEYALHLEGLPRHPSTHAAGVVISPRPLTELIPLHITKNAAGSYTVSTQFAKETVEDLGLLKMDFLGLRTLTVIRDILELIAKNGKEVPDMDHMTYDDQNVYGMISRADTTAVFQLESGGMTQFMTQLKPDCLEDIIAGISLYRPGPMKRIPDYLKGKFDRGSIKYLDERLRPILEPTYGTMVYQEQVMQMVRDIAGYSMGRSDLVRRAMAKKKLEVMEKERHNFIYGIDDEEGNVQVLGALRNGVSKEVAEKIFDEMLDFASYAFNKSHAAAYAVLAYKTAYLKYYFPHEFMTANINSFLGTSDKVAEYIYICRTMGIQILPPDVNESDVKFTTEGECIRIGLIAVKNAGGAVSQIVEERRANGRFKSFEDFALRVEGINKRMIESLIKAGAFSSLGSTRAELLECYDKVLERTMKERKTRSEGQVMFFDIIENTQSQETESVTRPEFSDKILASMEREALGVYVTSHPLNEYMNLLSNMRVTVSKVKDSEEDSGLSDGDRVELIGVVQTVSIKQTKSHNTMAICILEDLTGIIEIVLYPAVFSRFRPEVYEGAVVHICGKVNMSEERGNSVAVDDLESIDEYAQKNSRLYLRFTDVTEQLKDKAMEIMARYKGFMPVYFHNADTKKTQRIPEDRFVRRNDDMIKELCALLGEENVKITEASAK